MTVPMAIIENNLMAIPNNNHNGNFQMTSLHIAIFNDNPKDNPLMTALMAMLNDNPDGNPH